MFENFGRVAIASVTSVIVLFVLTKLMGKRQIAQMSIFDYVNGITIGSIAAEMAIARGEDFLGPVLAMVIYAIAAVIISYGSNKSIKLRAFFVGKPLVLMDNGTLYKTNFKKAHLDVNEFLTNCRFQGYFDLADVQTAVLETNGQISILPKSTARPSTPEDIGLEPSQDKMVANVIIDSRIMPNVLKLTGNDEQWLNRQLAEHGVAIGDVLLGTVDGDNVFTSYKRANPGDEEKNLFI